jgi:hypothetical protein
MHKYHKFAIILLVKRALKEDDGSLFLSPPRVISNSFLLPEPPPALSPGLLVMKTIVMPQMYQVLHVLVMTSLARVATIILKK